MRRTFGTHLSVILLAYSAFGTLAATQTWSEHSESRDEIRAALAQLDLHDEARTTAAARNQRQKVQLEALLQRYPEDLLVNETYQDFIKFTSGRDRATDWYKQRLTAQPNDLQRQFLYARMLIRIRTNEAKAMLARILERAPQFPWAHLELAKISSDSEPEYRNPEELKSHVEAFLDLRPADLRVWKPDGPASRVQDPAFLARAAPRLRALLEHQTRPEDASTWQTLWILEFRTHPLSEHPELRKQVARDVEKLRRPAFPRNFSWFETLKIGYEVTNDSLGLEWVKERTIEQFPDSSAAVQLVTKAWRKSHPAPEDATREEEIAYYRSLYAVSGEWTRRWPDYPHGWIRRFLAACQLQGLSAREVEATGDGLLHALEKNPWFQWDRPYAFQVAELYVKRGVRLKVVPALIEKGLEQRRGVLLVPLNPEERESWAREAKIQTDWMPLSVLVKAHLKAKNKPEARKALDRMARLLPESAPRPNVRPEEKFGDIARSSEYLKLRGDLAMLEKRKGDALAFYRSALAVRPPGEQRQDDELMTATRKLWSKLKGSGAGWETLFGTSPSAITGEELWEPLNKALPPFELTDQRNNVWTKSDLAGKVVFINIWATWCGPCRLELPYVQRLVEEWKKRSDVIILTLNVDENPAMIGPFLEQNRFTFPVLLAQSYVERIIPGLGIPKTWLVSSSGVLRMQRSGFTKSQSYQSWVAEMAKMVEQVRTAEPEQR